MNHIAQSIENSQINSQIRAENEAKAQKKKEKRGLEFMAVRRNIREKQRELRANKVVTPSEYYLLEEIIDGTVGAKNSKSTICSSAEFYHEDLSKNLGYKAVNKLWVLLKALEKKGLIIRQELRASKGREMLGLNPEAFGQVLIDSSHTKDKNRKRPLWIVVDNSGTSVDRKDGQHTVRDRTTHEPCSLPTRTMFAAHTNRVLNVIQEPEIIEEKSALDSSRGFLEGIRGQKQGPESGETNVSLGSGTGSQSGTKPKQLADYQAEKERQLAEFRKAGF